MTTLDIHLSPLCCSDFPSSIFPARKLQNPHLLPTFSSYTSILSVLFLLHFCLFNPAASLLHPLLAVRGGVAGSMRGGDHEPDVDRLPIDLLAQIFALFTSFKDMAQASSVCRKWRQAVKESLALRERLSFSGWKMDDDSTTRLVLLAYTLKELDISRSRWSCQISDQGLKQISSAKCISNLSSVSVWGSTAITDKGLVQLVSRAASLQHLNVGGTFITDASLFAVADSCPHLKTIVLWGCHHVTEKGLLVLVNKCHKLESINVWGMRIPASCFVSLLMISPALQIQPKRMLLDDERFSMWPVY